MIVKKGNVAFMTEYVESAIILFLSGEVEVIIEYGCVLLHYNIGCEIEEENMLTAFGARLSKERKYIACYNLFWNIG